MHAIAWGAVRTAHRPLARRSCRVIAGVRRPLLGRNFHRSTIAYRIPDNGGDANEEKNEPTKEEGQGIPPLGESETIEDVDVAQELAAQAQKPRIRGDYGSAARRSVRNRKPKEVPPVILPEWFWARNVECHTSDGVEDTRIQDVPKTTTAVKSGGSESGEIGGEPSGTVQSKKKSEASELDVEIRTKLLELEKMVDKQDVFAELHSSIDSAKGGSGTSPGDSPANAGTSSVKKDYIQLRGDKYIVSKSVYREIKSALRAGLELRPPTNVDGKDIIRPDTLLQCPRAEATAFLDVLIQRAATQLEADIVRLNSEDIAQIVGTYIGENIGWTGCDTALLGYESQKVSGKMETYEEPADEEEDDDAEGDDPLSPFMDPSNSAESPFGGGKPKGVLMKLFTGRPMNIEEILGGSRSANPIAMNSVPAVEHWADFKLTAALEAIVDAADEKRARESVAQPEGSQEEVTKGSHNLIIQVNEYREMSKTAVGRNILKRLRDVVRRKWLEGKNVIIVGTTTAEDPVPALTREAIRRLQSDVSFGDQRTIFVPPARSESQDFIMETDEKTYICNLNVRHLEDMLLKLSGETPEVEVDLEKDFPKDEALVSDIEDAVWGYPKVHRLALSMVGQGGDDTFYPNRSDRKIVYSGISFERAFKMLSKSDSYKFKWAAEEREKQKQHDASTVDFDTEKAESGNTATDSPSERMKRIKKTLTTHEKKLIGGIVQPSDIRTTFSDVRAPPETVEALKTLTSLSLIRPEAFSYGVLATDKIPGVLLYGPPGTGKTLLAKAVAKESGATVLEVSGSEIFDMYVGEGEKNIKALFSLAKKLSPCVVFIDEADAIFGARSSGSKRSSHREIINQFLREWDGMNELSAFIMVATNRPFDLDEAVLRRLPRRLLVDLPTESDRKEILKIHLKDEILDSSVQVDDLARNTPFYSGSDLKNLAVAAALACVREENAQAAAAAAAADDAHAQPAHRYPERRTLTKAHFDTALQEISASISEDMSTLSAIRKFDERYGDRKGRRKRAGRMGFGMESGLSEQEQMREREEESRVRPKVAA